MNKEVMLLAASLMLSGCATETLFRSKFELAQVDQAPTTAAIGTVTTGGGTTVIDPPVLPSGRWVQMTRPHADTAPALYQGNLSAVRGDGRYTFSAHVLVKEGAGIATIQFSRQNLPVEGFESFLHLDLMPNNTVRIDDNDASQFGSFTRDKPFIIQVTLDIDTSPTVTVTLAGDGASGTANHNITVVPHIFGARNFGSVRLSMSHPHIGTLQATNIAVTRRKD